MKIFKEDKILDRTVSLRELLDLCRKYDGYGHSPYPENRFEGESVFEEIFEELVGEPLDNPKELFEYY